jgi:hypothetical protein
MAMHTKAFYRPVIVSKNKDRKELPGSYYSYWLDKIGCKGEGDYANMVLANPTAISEIVDGEAKTLIGEWEQVWEEFAKGELN